ncbi:MAG: erythromycin esterase family protein [Gemmatimonadales bacterium]
MNVVERNCRWPVLVISVAVCLACTDATGTDSSDDPEPSWLQTHAVPIATADPEVSEPNLSVLGGTIGDARIVGMGEATHGTAEFWQIRQKLSRYLVEEMGFTAILHEAPFPNSLYIDAYVTEGEGTVLEAHRKLGYWRYQEMQDLIAWMREHNVQRGEQEPALHYFGYDCAFRSWTESINLIAGYLEVVDPAAVDEVTTRLNNYTLEDAQYVYDFLAANAAEYIAQSSADEYELILKIAENLEPSWQVWYNLEQGIPESDIREGFNIGNVNWIIENLLDGGKVIIWAHNGHVGNTYLENSGTQAQMLGSRLKEQYGEDYYIIGTEFYGGSFLAWDRCEGNPLVFTEHRAARPREDAYAYWLHQAGIPLFYLDLSQVNYSLEETSWLVGPLNIRLIGASYCAADDAEYYYSTSLPVHYDGIVHFEVTSPTTSIAF